MSERHPYVVSLLDSISEADSLGTLHCLGDICLKLAKIPEEDAAAVTNAFVKKREELAMKDGRFWRLVYKSLREQGSPRHATGNGASAEAAPN